MSWSLYKQPENLYAQSEDSKEKTTESGGSGNFTREVTLEQILEGEMYFARWRKRKGIWNRETSIAKTQR